MSWMEPPLLESCWKMSILSVGQSRNGVDFLVLADTSSKSLDTLFCLYKFGRLTYLCTFSIQPQDLSGIDSQS